MASNQEIPIGDDDLDALMEQLEVETAGLVTAPTVTAAAPAATVAPADDDGLDDLEAELADVTAVAKAATGAGVVSTDDTVALEQAKQARAEGEAKPISDTLAAKLAALEEDAPFEPTTDSGEVKQGDVDAEMAALEAELSDASTPIEKAHIAADALGKVIEKAMPEAAAEVKEKLTPEVLAEAKRKVLEDEEDAPAHPNPKRAPALDFHIDVDEFRRDTRVSETNLDNCFMEQAGLIAHYVAKHAQSEAQAARTKLQVEIAEAKLYDQHRKELSKGADKVTEKMVENAVRTDPKYAAIHVRLIEAESLAAINKGLVESLKQRRDMLIQLGADRREDGKGTARILAAQVNDANVAARALAAAKKVGE